MSNRLASSMLLGAALSASHFFARAQQAVAPPASPSLSAVDAMQLYLVAHDKRDKPVLDLKPDDLTITEDGSPVRLDNLRIVDPHQEPKQAVTFVFDPFPAEKGGSPQKISARIATARDAALKILSMLSESGFEFSVFNIDSRLHLLQEFTSDLSATEAAIQTATGPLASRDKGHASESEKEIVSVALSGADSAGKRASAPERLQAQSIYAALRNSSRIAQDRHISPSLSSILALVQSQQGLAGRKTIIYLSSMHQEHFNDADKQTVEAIVGSANQPLGVANSMHQEQIKNAANQAIESIVGSANQAGIGINVVDGPALGHHGSQVKLMSAGSQSLATSLAAADFGSLDATLEVVDEAPINTDLKHLAEATGGTYFNGDGMKPMYQLVGDMTTYYGASFVPRSEEYDGRLHPIVVKPLRTGLRIRTQTGYLALPPPSADGSRVQPFELPLLKLLKESPLPSQFPFRAAILDMGDSDEGRRTTLAIEVPVEDLNIQKDGNSPSSLAHLTMIADVKDQTGAVAAHFSSNTPQRVAFHQDGVKGAEVVSLQRHFILPPGKYTLEALIVETTSGKAAAQRIPFEVSSKTDTPSLSNMILVRRTDPVPSTDDDTADPLRDDKSHVTPNLSGALPSGDSSPSIFFVVHDNAHSLQPAKLEIKVLRDGQILGGAPLVARQVHGGEHFSYLGNFSLKPATDGKYQVEALLTQDGKTAESDTSFILSGVEGADPAPSGDVPALESISRPAGPLAIAVSANPVPRPPDNELKALLAEAAQYANDFWDSLPNFTCQQITERFAGSSRGNNWEHIDTLTGQLNYFDRQEDWVFEEYEKNHKKSRDSSSNNGRGISDVGIFGGLIRGLFRPAAKAEISWLETDALGDRTVQVFKYRVAKENSNLVLRAGPMQVVVVGYHGMVYIDSATHGVRRILQIADDVPKNYPIHGSLISADYDYASISDQEYLLPKGAQIVLRRSSNKNKLELNQIRFRDFHLFRSTARILSSTPTSAP
jgi:VWFA-related protein